MPKQDTAKTVAALNLKILPFDVLEAYNAADFAHLGIPSRPKSSPKLFGPTVER